MNVAPAGRFDGTPPPSATSVMVLPRMVMTTLRRGELETPSISTPARITVTGGAGAIVWAQPAQISPNKLSRKIQRFTCHLQKGWIVLPGRSRR